jgi:ABC-type uncharacterized transport system permease subunit
MNRSDGGLIGKSKLLNWRFVNLAVHDGGLNILLLLLIIILLLLTAIELWLGGSSPYTSTDKTIKNKYT